MPRGNKMYGWVTSWCSPLIFSSVFWERAANKRATVLSLVTADPFLLVLWWPWVMSWHLWDCLGLRQTFFKGSYQKYFFTLGFCAFYHWFELAWIILFKNATLLLLHGKLNQHFVALPYPCHKTTFPTRSDTLYIYIYTSIVLFSSLIIQITKGWCRIVQHKPVYCRWCFAIVIAKMFFLFDFSLCVAHVHCTFSLYWQ